MATDPAESPAGHDGVTGVRNVGKTAESEPPHCYRAGDIIDDRFQLIRKVGAGGMGTVWVAHNLVLDVQVGIKLITFRGSKNRAALTRRLLDEARSAARLGHSAVIKVHDFGVTSHGDPFIAMELLGGEDLASLLERQQNVSPEIALQMLLPIAHGLSAAHDKGIVHRDIKPENIFLAREDDGETRPKILDFGIARMVDSPTKLTLEGTPLGTPEYMSPELARGETAEATSDIWSFSVVLYELLVGEPPFVADNYNALMQRILHDEPVALAARGSFDAELDAIVMKGLCKEPQDRWGNMRDMGRALAKLLLSRGITEDIGGTSLRRSWLSSSESVAPEASAAQGLAGLGGQEVGDQEVGGREDAGPDGARSERRPPISQAPTSTPDTGNTSDRRARSGSAEAFDSLEAVGESTPVSVPPSSAVPSSAVPSSAVPSSAVPSSAVPSSAVPSSAVPSSAVPSSAVPSSAVPSSAVPSSAAPDVDLLPPKSWSSPDTDEFQLAAIAEMNRGGDPVEVLERAEKRRTLFLVAAVIVFSVTLVGSILFGTGVIGGV